MGQPGQLDATLTAIAEMSSIIWNAIFVMGTRHTQEKRTISESERTHTYQIYDVIEELISTNT